MRKPKLFFNWNEWFQGWNVFFENEEWYKRQPPTYMSEFLEKHKIKSREDFPAFKASMDREMEDYLKKEDRDLFAEYLKKINDEDYFCPAKFRREKNKIEYVNSFDIFSSLILKNGEFVLAEKMNWDKFFYRCFYGRKRSFHNCDILNTKILIENSIFNKSSVFEEDWDENWDSISPTTAFFGGEINIYHCTFNALTLYGKSTDSNLTKFVFTFRNTFFYSNVFKNCSMRNVRYVNVEFSDNHFHDCTFCNSEFRFCHFKKGSSFFNMSFRNVLFRVSERYEEFVDSLLNSDSSSHNVYILGVNVEKQSSFKYGYYATSVRDMQREEDYSESEKVGFVEYKKHPKIFLQASFSVAEEAEEDRQARYQQELERIAQARREVEAKEERRRIANQKKIDDALAKCRKKAWECKVVQSYFKTYKPYEVVRLVDSIVSRAESVSRMKGALPKYSAAEKKIVIKAWLKSSPAKCFDETKSSTKPPPHLDTPLFGTDPITSDST